MEQPASLIEYPIRGDRISLRVSTREHLCRRRTAFQQIDVYDTEALGRVLLLDGHIQLSELDEHAYHEALVHIPFLSLQAPRSALVVGGGDGGAVRELAKHAELDLIEIVEIDEGVLEECARHLPFLQDGAFDDPRVKVHIGDALAFLGAKPGPYDLIVLDVTDVYEDEEGELSEQVFSRDFYVDCKNALRRGGILVTQADNHVLCPFSLGSVLAMLSSVFPRVGCYQAAVPSFGGFSGYAWASEGAEVRRSMPLVGDVALRYLSESTWRFALEMELF